MVNVFTEFIKPLFRGQAQECFENARREWQLRKKRGEDPVYWIGRVYGYSIEDDPEKKLPAPVHHAWVTVGDKIADPSPFRYGKGKWSRLPDMPAEDFWLPGTEYRGDYIVDDERLDEPIYYMPTEEEMKKGGNMAFKVPEDFEEEISIGDIIIFPPQRVAIAGWVHDALVDRIALPERWTVSIPDRDNGLSYELADRPIETDYPDEYDCDVFAGFNVYDDFGKLMFRGQAFLDGIYSEADGTVAISTMVIQELTEE